jgi:hypothetical protein
MAYCNIQDRFIGKKLDKMFLDSNRNKMANILSDPEFLSWFGNGRKDAEGNPVIDEIFAITNEKGEKKTIFDFPAIIFNSDKEIKKLLSSSPAINLWGNSLFINNDTSGELVKRAVKLVDMVNFYYPKSLYIEQYKRVADGEFSKSSAIPVPVIKISDGVRWNNRSTMFSFYGNAHKPSKTFNQLHSADAVRKFRDEVSKHGTFPLSLDEVAKLSDFPKASETLYTRLVDFLKKLNPEFRVEEFDKLPANAISYINDFLIEIESSQKFKAMPEEVAHFFIELLPKDSALRVDLLQNITNFSIYSLTLSTYKSLPEYQLENGQVDYEKIKREAAAKLLAEFIFASENDDMSRIDTLTKVKDNWLTQWWKRFISWLKSARYSQKKDAFKAYKEAVDKILSGDISDLTFEEAQNNVNNNIFFSISDSNKIFMAQQILGKVNPAGKIEQLQDVINDFRRSLNKSFASIVTSETLTKLKEKLKEDPNDDYIFIYEIFDMVKRAKVNEEVISNGLAIDSQILNMSEFLGSIIAMEKVAKAIDLITDEYVKNPEILTSIKELEAIRSAYTGFTRLIDSKLMRVLTDSKVETDIRKSLADTASIFRAVDDKIVNILRQKLGGLFNSTLSKQNDIIVEENIKILQNLLQKQFTSDSSKDALIKALRAYSEDLKTERKIDAKIKLLDNLKALNVSQAILKSKPVNNIFDRIESLYFNPQFIEDMLRGEGKDIDQLSNMSHFVTAGVKNYDSVISNVAKFVTDRKTKSQELARTAILNFESKVNPILKQLSKEFSTDEYKAGELITYIDEIKDESKDKNGEFLYEGGRRKIVKYLTPWEMEAYIQRDILFEQKRKSKSEWEKDKNDNDKKAVFLKAKKDYDNFLDQYFNSPFKRELRDFEKTWAENELFVEIIEEWRTISAKEREIEKLMDSGDIKQSDIELRADYRREKANLLNEKNKIGRELEKTLTLKKYFEESKKFRTIDKNRTKRNYEAAKNLHLSKINTALADAMSIPAEQRTIKQVELRLRAYLKNKNLSISNKYLLGIKGYPDYYDQSGLVSGKNELDAVRRVLMDKWETTNNVLVKTDTHRALTQRIMDKIKELKTSGDISPIDERIALLSEKMYEILSNRNDTFGQKDPTLLSQDEKDSVLVLEEAINNLKLASGFMYFKVPDSVKNSPSISDEYKGYIKEYEDRRDDFVNSVIARTLSEEQINEAKREINDLTTAMFNFGLLTNDQKQKDYENKQYIKDLWKLQSLLSETLPTEYYKEGLTNVVSAIEDLIESEQKKLNDSTISDTVKEHLSLHIESLNMLLNGKFDKDGKRIGGYGLRDAVTLEDYSNIETIFNDEYIIDGKIIRFKYLMDREGGYLEEINPEVFNWFNEAHVRKQVFLRDLDENGEPISDKARAQMRDYTIAAYYKYSIPRDMKLSDFNSVLTEGLTGELYEEKVAKKYISTKISDEFFEKQISHKDSSNPEDWTVDNKAYRPDFLPLSRKQRRERGITDTKYLNKSYYSLMDATDKKSSLLKQYYNEAISLYLAEQENKPDEIKSFMNLPVTRLDSYQRIVANVTKFKDRAKFAGQTIGAMFTKSKDIEAEDMLGGTLQLRDVDETTQQIMERDIPALGMNAKLPIERVNRNINHAMMMYLFNSKDYDARIDAQPTLKALIDVMKANEDSAFIGQKKRRAIIEKIYSQMIVGQLPESIDNADQFRRLANNLMGLSAMKIMLDTTGGAINYVQANVNNLIEAFAGKYISPKNYRVGLAKATHLMADLAADFTKKDDYRFWTMMYQSFDFIQGDMVDDITERSASKNKIFDIGKLVMYPRKNGELHAQGAMAIAILDATKVKNQIDGKEYPVWDIYKKDGNKLVLKEGFYELNEAGEKTYPYNTVDGAKYMAIKNRIHSINLDLHGNYAKINQTEASRYSIGKLMENMKRWFVAGFQRRFGRYHYDVEIGDTDEGFYRSSSRALWNLLKNLFTLNMNGFKAEVAYISADALTKQNLRRAAAETAISMVLFMLSLFAFGYDGDDPDKNKKIKASSWLHNELLLITLRTYAEQTAYFPVPGFGFSEMSRNLLDPFSVAKSTFGNAAALIRLAMLQTGYYMGITPEDKVYYERNEGGIFNEKGDSKFLNYLFKTFGYNGAQFDPGYYIQNYQAMQNRLK